MPRSTTGLEPSTGCPSPSPGRLIRPVAPDNQSAGISRPARSALAGNGWAEQSRSRLPEHCHDTGPLPGASVLGASLPPGCMPLAGDTRPVALVAPVMRLGTYTEVVDQFDDHAERYHAVDSGDGTLHGVRARRSRPEVPRLRLPKRASTDALDSAGLGPAGRDSSTFAEAWAWTYGACFGALWLLVALSARTLLLDKLPPPTLGGAPLGAREAAIVWLASAALSTCTCVAVVSLGRLIARVARHWCRVGLPPPPGFTRRGEPPGLSSLEMANLGLITCFGCIALGIALGDGAARGGWSLRELVAALAARAG